MSDAEAVCRVLHAGADALRAVPARRGASVHLPSQGRLLATGDLHDNPFHFARVIRAARLEHGADHHVTLHELIHGEQLVNGVDLSYRMLVRAAHLAVTFPGQVHPLLANHELSQAIGRGVSKGAGNSLELFRDGLAYVFGESDGAAVEAAVVEFIRAMPLAVRTASGILCAHALPSASRADRFDPAVLDRALTDGDLAHPDGSAWLMTWGREWTDELVERLAAAWDVRVFVLGHRHVESGIECIGTRIIVLNSDHAQGRMLPIDLTQPFSAEDALFTALPVAS